MTKSSALDFSDLSRKMFESDSTRQWADLGPTEHPPGSGWERLSERNDDRGYPASPGERPSRSDLKRRLARAALPGFAWGRRYPEVATTSREVRVGRPSELTSNIRDPHRRRRGLMCRALVSGAACGVGLMRLKRNRPVTRGVSIPVFDVLDECAQLGQHLASAGVV